jgi:putative CocE/NonD family hydrolase
MNQLVLWTNEFFSRWEAVELHVRRGGMMRLGQIAACAIAMLAWILGGQDAWAASPVPNALPPATYPATYSKQQWITMDDGIKLGATITFPSENGSTPAPGRFPVILSMTPYGRNGICGCAPAADFATRGFAVAVVDVRGTGGSQSNLDQNYFSPREARDGYNLVEYLGTQPWSTGKVGMSGGSYVGIVQYKTAATDPPHLAAIAPDEALADLYNDAYAPGGIVSLSFDAQYLGFQPAAGLATNTDPSMLPGTITAAEQQATGRPIALDYLENPFDDAFYRIRSPITEVAKIKVPVFVQDGWRDAFQAGNIRMFQALESRAGAATYLNVGPCTHKGCGGEFAPTDNPPGQDNVEAQEIQFDQKYLMGMNVPDLPRVRLYDQQANQYIDTTSWPPPQTTFKRVYLGRGTLSATGLGTGTISSSRPQPATARYFTDPAAGLSMSLDEQGTLALTPYVPTDQRLERGQGLTWRSGPLANPLTHLGPIALHLVAASSATNTDWFAKISDVSPNGSEAIVAEGQLRASLRALAPGSTPEEPLQSLDSPQPIKPGRFYDYEIAIAPTGYTFAKGDRLQIRLTSNNLPNALPGTLDLNPSDPANAFTPLPPAFNTVRFGGRDGSSLLLPVYR